ncbi:zinc-ribbon domain-containing protein [Maribacter sp. 2-571]|uniref:zinc-ribbon domain-containing protein n=1 Tax=Maribacter sp. 2-571 TaxID=3417569 RepID=UPI003D35701D
MIFFYGTRASKIKEYALRNTSCSYCNTRDSFHVTTYSRYFHFFWIPIIPLYKTSIAECSHCKKTYAEKEFSADMQKSFSRQKLEKPSKRPLWQGCGCLVLVVLGIFFLSMSFYGVYLRSNGEDTMPRDQDPRKQLLDTDIKQLTLTPDKQKDSIGSYLKACVAYDIVSGIDTDKIAYFTKTDRNKLLVLLRIRDMKRIAAADRKVVITIIEDCLSAMENMEGITEYYLGVEGKWNTLLVKTPFDADLSGRFADKYKLLPFYGADTINLTNQKDSIPPSPVHSEIDTVAN